MGTATAHGQPQPSVCLWTLVQEQRAATAVLLFLSQLERPQGPRSWPSRGSWDSHKWRRRSMSGFSCLLLKCWCWLSGRLCVCLMGSVHQNWGLCGLGLWCLWAEFVSGKLFLSELQVNSRQILTPLSCYSLPKKLCLNFEICPFIFCLPDPASANSRALLSGECPPGTAYGNGGGEFSPPEILFCEMRMPGFVRWMAAGSSVQWGLVCETLGGAEDHFSGERGQGRDIHTVTAAQLMGDGSLSCHGSMVTECMASTSKANTQALIKFALIIILVEFSPAWAPLEQETLQLAG